MATRAVDTAEMVQAILQERFPFLKSSVLDAVDKAFNARLDPHSELFAEHVALAMKLDDGLGVWANESPDPKWVIKMVEEGLRFEEELLVLEYQSLRRKYNEMISKRGRRRDKHAFFSHPAHTPNFDVWNRRSHWTVEEAVALSLDKEPASVNTNSLSHIPSDSPFKQDYEFRLDVLRRRLGSRAEELIPATEYAVLLSRDFSIPPNYGVSPSVASSSAVQGAQSEIDRLQNEIKALKADIAEMRKQPEDFDKHGSMSKLIYCIAVNKFHLKPGRSSATANIEKCIDAVAAEESNPSLSLSTNTIKGILDRAAAAAAEGRPK